MKLRFYARKCKQRRDGTSPVEVSVTVDKRKIITLPLSYNHKKFLKDRFSKEYVETEKQHFSHIYLQILQSGLTPTTDLVIDYYRNGAKSQIYTLGNLWDDFNEQLELKDRAGEMTLSNRTKYNRAVEAFFTVINKGMPAEDLKRCHIEKLSLELKLKGLKDVSISGYLAKIKTMVLFGMNNGKLSHNPFYGIKIVKSSPETIRYLTEEEIETIKSKDLCGRLSKVRDIFLFSCFSGLAYTDMAHLTAEDIKCDENGEKWLKKQRGKTGVTYTVPLLPEAEEILSKYGGRLPMISNVRLNGYLKEIGDICHISTNLTCHVGRHTFACLLIQKGLPLEVIAKALGHSNTNTTKIYAKLLDKTVVETIRNAFTKMAG